MIQFLNILIACVSMLFLSGCDGSQQYQYTGQTETELPFNPNSFWTTNEPLVEYYKENQTILITGPITEATLTKFASYSAEKIKVVIIASPGGGLAEAIQISKFISYNNIDTIIPNKGMCYSACTLIFQAGHHRFAFSNAMLMYHSAKNSSALTNNPIPSESATAIFWTYLVLFGVDENFFEGMNLETDYYISPERSMQFNIVTHLIPVDNKFGL